MNRIQTQRRRVRGCTADIDLRTPSGRNLAF
jgi:hypothetical protein